MLTAADLRPDVLQFALAMEAKLREHDEERGTAGWLLETPGFFAERLLEEVGELLELVLPTRLDRQFLKALLETASVAVGRVTVRSPTTKAKLLELRAEAADVANIAMMLIDVSGALEA